MLERNLVLKGNELFLAGETETDGSREHAAGLYVRDTRHLDRFRITVNGKRPETLAIAYDELANAMLTCANHVLNLESGAVLPPQQLLIEERVSVLSALHVSTSMRNYSRMALTLDFSVELSADFRDLFDIRGFPRTARGSCLPPRFGAQSLVLGYRGLDERIAETEIRFDREPVYTTVVRSQQPSSHRIARKPSMSELVETPAIESPEVAIASFPVTLAPGETWSLNIEVTPKPADGIPVAPLIASNDPAVEIVTSNHALNRVIHRCLADLAALQTTFPNGEITSAGIPWFVAPFGRDSLICGLQTLYLAPERAIGTLRMLARMQGNAVDSWREEEPGKIPHECRYGEMARLDEVPHTPYYGTVDATPLFVWLFAETALWTGDREFIAELMPKVERALEWINEHGDLDGDGFVEYRSEAVGTARITNQVWKDSHDSLNHADGSPVTGPIAAVEVQGYVFAAYDRLAAVMNMIGDRARADDFRHRAERIRRLVEDQFWMPQANCYAQALDGHKRQVQALTSNAGHLLMAGLPSTDRAMKLRERLMASDIDTGWGIRTLSSESTTYNPMSYHNGSVWPHDNSMIAMGFLKYGAIEAAHRIMAALFDAAAGDPRYRLPELFCGFPRAKQTGAQPVRYPVSCSPQAWAAGALPLLIRGVLGLDVDPSDGKLRVAPALPDWLDWIELRNLRVRGKAGSLRVERSDTGYRTIVSGFQLAGSG